jgi:predicted DNA-binding transcriptional regulator YafY
MQPNDKVTFTYKNYRGEISVRLVRPIMIAFGETGYHPGPQWYLHAWDVNKNAERTFTMKDIKDWEQC